MKIKSLFSISLFVLEIFLLILGQIGRVTLTLGISFYALEVVIFIHVCYLIFKSLLFEWFGLAHHKLRREDLSEIYPPKEDSKSKLLISTFVKNRTVRLTTLWITFSIVALLIQSPQFSQNQNIRAFSYILRIVNIALYALIVIPSIPKKMVDYALDVLSFAVPLLALVQYIFLPDLRFLAAYGWDPHMYRGVGTIFDPPIMGSILGMLFIYNTIKITKYKNIKIEKYKITVSNTTILVFLYFSILFLFSRSTYLAVIIATSGILFLKRKYFLLFCFCTIFLLSIYLAPRTIPAYERLESAKIERLSTVTSRQTEIVAGLTAFIKNPLWGIGYNRVREFKESSKFPRYNRDTQVPSSKLKQETEFPIANHAGSAYHSFWVTQLATTGVIGFGLLLWFFAELFRKKLWFAPIFFIPAFIGLFDNTIFHPFVMLVMIVIYFSNTEKNYEKM